MIDVESISSDTCLLRLHDLDDCDHLAKLVAHALRSANRACAVGLVGTLGAGKTQWTKFFAKHWGVPEEDVSSPTYMLVHRYDVQPALYHLDAYRVGDADEFLELGVEELLEGGTVSYGADAGKSITVIEWADRFREYLPDSTLWITFEPVDGDPQHRRVRLDGLNHYPDLLSLLREVQLESID